ncbi:hypothetical protein HYPSUDRAFT_816951 [Hypholoma sublateritium FD-334 SS-4]|uniref:Uncharacterized protein n=1 Tax=Hypholoma sublateritium (strain FD-334 SS-4) TaxID=945553 RepID=A0A0D2MAE5_HYPSF|nr:hypothetical protein HYPSUDRAFT_816951 [Hypholoma sublateritium FD-334 SS-4]
MLFGRSIWKKNFVGETMSIRAIRGILAIVVLSAVFFYTLLNVIFAPIKEAALSPVKTYRISGIAPTDLLDHTFIPVWMVTYALPLQSIFTDGPSLSSLIPSDLFFSAVGVTAIWPAGLLNSGITLPQCYTQITPDNAGNESYYSYLCPPADVVDYTLPDLYITVDFGPLFTGLAGIDQPSGRTQLPLVIGLSNDLFNDYTHTVPVTIIPGMNMAAPYILGMRQIYTNVILATLGFFEASTSFFLPQILGFYPDPFATFNGSTLSTLNIFAQDNYGEVNFLQDYREKSVIGGFSSVGGLWTAFSGIFAILFGASMLHIFYGSKPLSIFGMAHKFQAEAMKKDCLAKYPQILKENCAPEDRGLLSLLRDHLINLDFVEDENDDPSSSEVWEKQIDLQSVHIPVAQVPAQRYSNTPR